MFKSSTQHKIDGSVKRLILFVYGLGGDPQNTWGNFPAIIRSDPKLQEYDIGFFRYPTSLFRLPFSKKYPKIQTLADALRTVIENKYADYKSIILVCHSLGGLIGRKYLLEEVKNERPLKVSGVLLYAVPNDGTALAAVGKMVSVRHNQLRQLCKDADVIRDVGSDWIALKMSDSVKTRYVVAALDRVVDEHSARVFWGNPEIETLSDRGHINCVKPRDAQDISYLILKNFIGSIRAEEDASSGLQKYATRARPFSHGRPAGSRFRVIGFDLDGTLLRGYEFSWTLVWEFLKVPGAVSKEARRKYLASKKSFADYQEWCEHDLRHMRQRALRREQFADITKSVSVTNNLIEALTILRDEGFVLAIISGGIDAFIKEKIPNAEQLFDYICVNRLEYDDQGIVCAIEPTPFDFAGKATALDMICKDHGVTLAEAVFVGEGMNDAYVAQAAGLSIAYPPHGDVIPASSRAAVEEDDLLKILSHVL
jgi:HAD superfamily phosphoserine phosphatase-like hydrolase